MQVSKFSFFLIPIEDHLTNVRFQAVNFFSLAQKKGLKVSQGSRRVLLSVVRSDLDKATFHVERCHYSFFFQFRFLFVLLHK